MNKFYLSLYSYESDEERNINDAITDQFRAILQDVTVYYSKKLDMYRIKMEHHQRTRPDNGHYELAFILMEIYNDHPNREELWKDMFCRILGPIFSMNLTESPEPDCDCLVKLRK